ncbi:MAG TPA: L,D-transpeptidase family protein [Chitinophagaceae bacterium]|nr:L,D-transpeptidase family protein [Chitinophagaceae bacterium]
MTLTLIWSDKEEWKPVSDSLYELILHAQLYGLFPEDYHAEELKVLQRRYAWDSLGRGARKDALFWAQKDMLLTDAFVQIVKDIRIGRLPHDSITLNKDSLSEDFYWEQMKLLQQPGSLSAIIESLEPRHRGYQLLKKGIRKFLDSADFRSYTTVPRPKDSINFRKALQKRLYEGGYIAFDSVKADSAQLAEAVKRFQKEKGISVDGRAGEGTLRMLNLSDREKFIRIAISMDKYKKLPPRMPVRYIWVNASSNYLDVIENGEVEFSSKVICGKPYTRTPLLNSAVSILITYPQWVPPPSIVAKEILPAVKKNPGYLLKKGFSLLDKEGNEVDPYTVDWSKYSKAMPYRVVQGSGDANALGILKFHFDNKYSVYLHDTNQRYLFANAMRSLSHGCVRVQDWERLALYILRNDSVRYNGRYNQIDSMKTWLKNKEKHQIAVRNRMPVYIRYITCEGKDGGVVFYDDVYGEDRFLKEKYFALK